MGLGGFGMRTRNKEESRTRREEAPHEPRVYGHSSGALGVVHPRYGGLAATSSLPPLHSALAILCVCLSFYLALVYFLSYFVHSLAVAFDLPLRLPLLSEPGRFYFGD